MFRRLLSLLSREPAVPDVEPRCLFVDDMPDVIYAVGDVHGRLDLLRKIEERIVQDASSFGADRHIVMLGDYIDRGPQSAGVLDHLSGPAPAGFRRHCILGNHEAMMLRFFQGRHNFDWLGNGGYQTLESYGISQERAERSLGNRRKINHLLDSYIPEEHMTFLNGLYQAIGFARYEFQHYPPTFPGEGDDSDESRMALGLGLRVKARSTATRVMHGHRIVENVSLEGRSVNLDTGAYLTGRLSALRLARDEDMKLL